MKQNDKAKFILISIKVTPNAPKDAILGWKEGRLCVKVQGVPEKGRANERLIEFLAEQLGISRSRLTIVSGETSRLKRIRIDDFTIEDLHQKLG
jgi:uncharacterized protein